MNVTQISRSGPVATAVAFAQFCDDVRVEATGKLMLVGVYNDELTLAHARVQVDHISVVTHIRWPTGLRLTDLIVHLRVPGAAPMIHRLVVPTLAELAVRGPRSTHTLSGVTQLRFPALRAGDTITCSVQANDVEIEAGQLHVCAAPVHVPTTRPAPTRH